MDCCICSPMASTYRLPRNAICAPCHEGAKAIIAFLDDNDDGGQDQQGDGGGRHGSVVESSRGSSAVKPNTSRNKGMRDALEQVKQMRGREAAAKQRAAYLEHGFALAWREGLHTDIIVKPGTGPPMQAHKAILAARSEVFRHALSSDDRCKKQQASPAAGDDDSISLPELSGADLSLFLAFLYTGALEEEDDDDRHLHALLVAGDKYDVPFLRRACEDRLAAKVDPSNVLRTLEVAELSGSDALKERAVGAVVEHAEQVVFSPEYAEFAVRNAALCVEITRALLLANNKKKSTTAS